MGLLTGGGERGALMSSVSVFCGVGVVDDDDDDDVERVLGADDLFADTLAGGDDDDGELAGEVELPESWAALEDVAIVAVENGIMKIFN